MLLESRASLSLGIQGFFTLLLVLKFLIVSNHLGTLPLPGNDWVFLSMDLISFSSTPLKATIWIKNVSSYQLFFL